MSELLDLALQAHGGLERWSGVQSLDVHVSLTGGLYLIKGYPEGVPNVTMRIDARRPAVIISPYARPDHRGYFTPDRVWIEDRAGRVIDEREHPRDSFAGHVLETPWDQLHRLYFTSYAMWNYLTTPFLFTQPGVKQNYLTCVVDSRTTSSGASLRWEAAKSRDSCAASIASSAGCVKPISSPS